MRDCPRGLVCVPERVCLRGKKQTCKWWVSDRDSRYCMWLWIQNHPAEEKPNTFKEIAKALGGKTFQRVEQYNKEALKKLREGLKKRGVTP